MSKLRQKYNKQGNGLDKKGNGNAVCVQNFCSSKKQFFSFFLQSHALYCKNCWSNCVNNYIRHPFFQTYKALWAPTFWE